MTSDGTYLKCAFCNKTYTKEQAIALVNYSTDFYPNLTNDIYKIRLQCSKCRGIFEIILDFISDDYGEFSDAYDLATGAAFERSVDETIEQYEYHKKEYENYRNIVGEPVDETKLKPGTEEAFKKYRYHKKEFEYLQKVVGESSDNEDTHSTNENKIELFQETIKNIDKNFFHLELNRKIVEALEIIVDVSPSYVEACFKIVKDEFKLTARDIEAFRKDLNSMKIQIEKDEKKKQYKDLVARLSKPPKELSADEKQEAIAYLQHPNLINNVLRDIAYAGEVINEQTNCMMLYLSAISRKFQEPISLVIFGKSSSGKSYLANAIEKFVPPKIN